MKVTKISINPTRTIPLGEFESAKLSAGVEIEFDKPVSLKSKKVKEAFDIARKIVKEEFIEQYKPYKKLLKSRRK